MTKHDWAVKFHELSTQGKLATKAWERDGNLCAVGVLVKEYMGYIPKISGFELDDSVIRELSNTDCPFTYDELRELMYVNDLYGNGKYFYAALKERKLDR